MAEQHDIDWTQLNGTGSTGRIRERDVTAAVAPTSDVIPLSPIRRTIAAHMVESRQQTAPVTLTITADATNLVNLRGQFKAAGGVVPAYTDFLLKLVAVALQRHPMLAARWSDAGLRLAPGSTSAWPWTATPGCSCQSSATCPLSACGNSQSKPVS